jgi:predicted house-cleaning noncanonical NTP pyrophosphatase (MazG superfamily)
MKSKLVRDLIPDEMARNHHVGRFHIADPDEYRLALRAKLQEEVDEFLAVEDPEELADILEVVLALARVQGADVFALAKLKRDRRGGLTRRIIWDGVDR